MDCFDRIEALIDAGGEHAVSEARALLDQFKGNSPKIAAAVDELLLELMTSTFLAEAGRDTFQRSAQRLAHLRLSKLKLMLSP